jgi:hypothetical protein
MILDKHTWVCSICGQGLTRKSTAKRHNNNQHLGGAMLVRPYEYVIGRLNGKFLESDPSLYRHNKRVQNKDVSNSVYQHDYDAENIRMGFGAVPNNNTTYERGHEDVRQQHTKFDDINRMFYAQFGPPRPPSSQQPFHKPVDNVKAPDNTVKKISERTLKLTEFRVLANKLCPPEVAAQMIIIAGMQANAGDDDSLNMNLEFLRNIDRAMSGSQ